MNNKRAFFELIFFFTSTAFILISSCSHSDKEITNTIVFWHQFNHPEEQKSLDSLVAAFEEEYNCSVKMKVISNNDFIKILNNRSDTSATADLLAIPLERLAEFISRNLLAELNPDSIITRKVNENFSKACFHKEKCYASPWLVNTRVLFYNKGILKKAGIPANPPQTIGELLDLADEINGTDSIYGFGAVGSDRHNLYKALLPFIYAYGGKILDSSGIPVINSGHNEGALYVYLKLSQSGLLETQRGIESAFAAGRLVFCIASTGLLEKIKASNSTLEFGVVPIPGISACSNSSVLDGYYLGVSKKSKNNSLAIALLKYLSAPANAMQFCSQNPRAGFPTAKFKDEYSTKNPYLSVFVEQLDSCRVPPLHPKWSEIESILESAAADAIYSRKSARGALDDAQAEVENLLKRYYRIRIVKK